MKIRLAAIVFAILATSIHLSAAVITVGPSGDYATVQAAIDAATATPADDELHLRATTFYEQINTNAVDDTNGRLEISGGWDATYTTRDPSPGATVIDGSSSGRVWISYFATGDLVLRGLTFQNGLAGTGEAFGAGLYLVVTGAATATIEDCVFDSNVVTTTDSAGGAVGGGADIIAGGTAEVRLAGVTFTNNEVFIDDTVGAPIGAGLRVSANTSSTIVVRWGSATGNHLNGGSQRRGGGISVDCYDSGTVEVEDFAVVDNHGSTVDAGTVEAHGVDVSANGTGVVKLRRLTVTDNWNGTGDSSPQVWMNLSGGTVTMSDSLVARGGQGVSVGTASATVYLSNLTVTDHEAYGTYVNAAAPGAATVSNSILWDNTGADLLLLGGASSGVSNLVNSDPMFVNAAGGDYRLDALSDAVDGGTASPAGGLGTFDLAHAPRTVGALPDQGAYERDAIFADDFERQDSRAWSATAP